MDAFHQWSVLLCIVLAIIPQLIDSAPLKSSERRLGLLLRKRSRDAAAATTMCGPDEFYDSVVEQCSRCADVCKWPQNPSCQVNCRGPKPTERIDISNGVATVLVPPSAGTVDETKYNEESLISNPLIWVSAVSLVIAVVATVAICVVIARRRKDQALGNTPLLSQVDHSSRTTSESSSEGGEPTTSGKHNESLVSPREKIPPLQTAEKRLLPLLDATDDNKLNEMQQQHSAAPQCV